MKIRLSWIIRAVVLVSLAAIIVPRLKYWMPSATPGASEPARAEQETPETTVNSVFQITDQGGGESENPKELLTDRLDDTHLVTGKDMTAEEQNFAMLFWDNQRSAAIYVYLRARLTTAASITSSNTNADSAVVSVAMKVFPEHSSDWVDSTCTVELKKRGPNWYVDELKPTELPGGIYQKFKQKLGTLR
jgi:hypothetical protein